MNLPPVAVLAGGLATRLFPITQKIPKSLVDVAGKPFVVRQLELLRRQGITRVVLCLGNLGEQVVAAVGDGSAYGVDIRYTFDGPTLLGTGGALKQALPLLDETFFVLYGDSYLDCDYRAIYDHFLHSRQAALMTVYHNVNLWDSSNILYRDGGILSYDKRNRTAEMQHIDYGLGVLKRDVFESLPAGQAVDLADIYHQLLKQQQLAGYEVFNRFYEIGSHAGLAETRAYFASEGA